MVMRWAWLETLEAMIEHDAKIRVWCEKCRIYRDISQDDLRALSAKVGPEYSLWNRRCRCRLTEGCDGWNKFSYLLGVYRPLAEVETLDRWIFQRSIPVTPKSGD